MNLTPSQQTAVDAKGDILVNASAGTGKTRTLVERCIRLLQSGESLESMLIVTFTEAAATEMRERIRLALRKLLDAGPDDTIAEQLALMDGAQISTLHSFCAQLLLEHFIEIGIDPQTRVLEQSQTAQLRISGMDELVEGRIGERGAIGQGCRKVVREIAGGSIENLKAMVWKIYQYSRSIKNGETWLQQQAELYDSTESSVWREWLIEFVDQWSRDWKLELEGFGDSETPLRECLKVIQEIDGVSSIGEAKDLICRLDQAADGDWPRGTKTTIKKEFESWFLELSFLRSQFLDVDGGQKIGMESDWESVREGVLTLIQMTEQFATWFRDSKVEAGGVDFNDLEQMALELIWDSKSQSPTQCGERVRSGYRHIFVDEYQDINPVQDALINALAGAHADGSRFLVGDVKQSIYRFRLADPHIFQSYGNDWLQRPGDSISVSLQENFRSRSAILGFVNSLFKRLLGSGIGGVGYGESAQLISGIESDEDVAVQPRVRLIGLAKTKPEGESESVSINELDSAFQEARLIASRLSALRESGYRITDVETGEPRPVDWNDMAILMRSPRGKAQSFARAFRELGVPLNVGSGDFFELLEIVDLLSLLRILDNPLQDIPLVTVLRSPLFGFSDNELAWVRAAVAGDCFFNNLQAVSKSDFESDRGETKSDELEEIKASAMEQSLTFITCYKRWRLRSQRLSVLELLELLLRESRYELLFGAKEVAGNAIANIQRLLELARQFEMRQHHGLKRFLMFIDELRSEGAEEESVAPGGVNSVTLLSIHRSKGLEFPVTVIADLAKGFNFVELQSSLLIHEKYSIASIVSELSFNTKHPSLPLFMARRSEKLELIAEELRLLYVATTRARDLLLLVGSFPFKKDLEDWKSGVVDVSVKKIASARSYLDWMKIWFLATTSSDQWMKSGVEGRNETVEWEFVAGEDNQLDPPLDLKEEGEIGEVTSITPESPLAWRYAFEAATRVPAKASVSMLRNQISADQKTEAISSGDQPVREQVQKGKHEASATDIGNIHHLFQQMVDPDRTHTRLDLQNEAERMTRAGVLQAGQSSYLNFSALDEFWQSDLGRMIRDHQRQVHRELPFTAKFTLEELVALGLPSSSAPDQEDFMVVQGVVDVALIHSDSVVLLDFKTDRLLHEGSLDQKLESYSSQLRLYGEALSKIYKRPVRSLWLHFFDGHHTVQVDC